MREYEDACKDTAGSLLFGGRLQAATVNSWIILLEERKHLLSWPACAFTYGQAVSTPHVDSDSLVSFPGLIAQEQLEDISRRLAGYRRAQVSCQTARTSSWESRRLCIPAPFGMARLKRIHFGVVTLSEISFWRVMFYDNICTCVCVCVSWHGLARGFQPSKLSTLCRGSKFVREL